MADLDGRVAIVTGASKGIGLATAAALRTAGAQVAMVARTEEALTSAAVSVGGLPIVADVSDADDVDRLARRVEAELAAAPDIIVNSAGAFSLAAFVDTDPADFARQLSVNILGPFLVTRRFLPAMLDRGTGHIVNVGSVAGRVALPGNAAYGASKFGLRGMHEVLVAELAGSGVRATLVEPAATDTPLWDPIDPDSREDLPARATMLTAERVAEVIRFVLAQPEGTEVSTVAVRSVG